jgi:hypothetical protein
MSSNNAVPLPHAGGGLPASVDAAYGVARDAATTAATIVGIGICKLCNNPVSGYEGAKESVKKLQVDGFTPLGLPLLKTRSLCELQLHWCMLAPVLIAMFALTVLMKQYVHDAGCVVISFMPAWVAWKFSARKDGGKQATYALLRGNGHRHVFVIRNKHKDA